MDVLTIRLTSSDIFSRFIDNVLNFNQDTGSDILFTVKALRNLEYFTGQTNGAHLFMGLTS